MTYSDYANKKFREQLDVLADAYAHQCTRADMAFERMYEWRKDEELTALRDSLNYVSSHSLLQLSDKELAAQKAFINEHYEKCAKPLRSKAAGNTWIYTLTGAGIGTVIEIECAICHAKQDITDTGSW